MKTAPGPVLATTAISKVFPGVRALDGVDFRLLPGEVHAVLGENGAGKSTLIKVLTGVYRADAGTVTLDGVPVSFASPQHATAAGVSTVYQEVNLCANLSVAENLFIGRQPRRFGMVDWRQMRRRAQELLAGIDLHLDVGTALGSHSLAVQQMVAIARAIDVRARVLILDEPTSSLDADEVAQLMRIMRKLRDQGLAILFVTHFLDQVYAIADRITVLRDGRLVGEYATADLPQFDLVRKMIGKELDVLERIERRTGHVRAGERSVRAGGTGDPGGTGRGNPVVEATGLGRTGSVEPFDLTIGRGEVVGLAGLLGSGRTEVARLLFGADRADRGELTVAGRPAAIRNPVGAVSRGIAFCSENRRTEGLVGELSVRENIILAMQASKGWLRRVPRRRQDDLVRRYVEALRIRPADPDVPVRHLSGGNQQKVLLARWLITEPKLLILDEPTRGIDVGAKAEIQRLVLRLSDDGMAVLFISAELEEVLRLSHQVAVMRDRRMVAHLGNDDELDTARVMRVIAGAPGWAGPGQR